MDAQALADRAQVLLDEATRARTAGDGSGCVQALERARQLLQESPLEPQFHKVSWRLAKAAYDFGRPDTMLHAIAPLLDRGNPFTDSAAARRALAPISTRWWDSRGYADDRIAALWTAWADAYRKDGDPWMEASGRFQVAWHRACAGDHAGLDQIVEHYLALDPRRFGTGPHRHPRAADPAASVWWAQLELVRIGLWQAVWAHRADRAIELLDAMEDAAEAAEVVRHDEVWFLDPVCRAGLAFGWEAVVERYAMSWQATLDRLDHPRAEFHQALAIGLLPTTPGADRERTLRRAMHLAEQGQIGAEWQIDVRLELARLLPEGPDTGVLQREAADLAQRMGVGAFSTHPAMEPPSA